MAAMSLIAVGKAALLVFIVLGCAIVVTAYVRNRRRVRPGRDPMAAGYLDLINGGVPPNPLPDWAEDEDGPEGRPDHPSPKR
jgi:hypothetical protein